MRIVFAGTPEFALPSLQALIDSTHELIAVMTQPDRAAGRGRTPRPSPVKQLALKHELPVWQPHSLREDDAQRTFAAFQADVAVVVAYGLLLPEAVLAAPKHGCVNVHASLLPRWRGAAPIQRALLSGDDVTGVCIMLMDAGLDTGPVLCRRELAIEPQDTGASLHDKLADLGAQALLPCLDEHAAGCVEPQTQPEHGVTYAAKLSRAEARIDWHRPAVELDRAVRAYNPWPGAYTSLDDTEVKLWRAEVVPTQGEPGQVLATGREGVTVAAGTDALRITQLQLPGKKPISGGDFCNARDLRNAQFV